MHNRFKEARASKKMTQNAVADILNITDATYSRYEAGSMQPPPSKLCQIADVFGVSIDYLLLRSNVPYLPSCKEVACFEEYGRYIQMYRALDHRGRKAVEDTLVREYAFVQAKNNR